MKILSRILIGLSVIILLAIAIKVPVWVSFIALAIVVLLGVLVVFGGTKDGVSLVLAIITLLATGATGFWNGRQFLKSAHWIKPQYAIAIYPSAIVLRQSAKVQLTATWGDGTSAPSLDGYHCKWRLSRPLPPPLPGDDCAIEITATPGAFAAMDPATITVAIGVEAAPPDDKPVLIDAPDRYKLRNLCKSQLQ
jgi:hypothetical protein